MLKNIEEDAFRFSETMRKISPLVIMRKFHINFEAAKSVYYQVLLKQHIEGRRLANEYLDRI